MRCDADAVHASKSTLNKMPRRRLLVGGVATAFLTIASALQPALRVRTPALARVTRPPVASAYTVLRAAENDDDTVAVEDEEAASDEADEAVEDGHELRHARHHDACSHDSTDDTTQGDRADEQCVELDPSSEERPAHGDDHADDAEDIPATRRLLVGQAAKRHDEEHACYQVGNSQLILCK